MSSGSDHGDDSYAPEEPSFHASTSRRERNRLHVVPLAQGSHQMNHSTRPMAIGPAPPPNPFEHIPPPHYVQLRRPVAPPEGFMAQRLWGDEEVGGGSAPPMLQQAIDRRRRDLETSSGSRHSDAGASSSGPLSSLSKMDWAGAITSTTIVRPHHSADLAAGPLGDGSGFPDPTRLNADTRRSGRYESQGMSRGHTNDVEDELAPDEPRLKLKASEIRWPKDYVPPTEELMRHVASRSPEPRVASPFEAPYAGIPGKHARESGLASPTRNRPISYATQIERDEMGRQFQSGTAVRYGGATRNPLETDAFKLWKQRNPNMLGDSPRQRRARTQTPNSRHIR